MRNGGGGIEVKLREQLIQKNHEQETQSCTKRRLALNPRL
jgi:hypothetical protein